MTDDVAPKRTGSVRLRRFVAEWVKPFLVERGFHRSGQTYRAMRGSNTLVVRFQTRYGLFTCEIGVISAVLAAAKPHFEPIEHWAIRLGPVAVGYDKWWDLDEKPESLAADFLAAFSKGLDYAERFSSDEGLLEEILRIAATDPYGIRPREMGYIQRLDAALNSRTPTAPHVTFTDAD